MLSSESDYKVQNVQGGGYWEELGLFEGEGISAPLW